MSAVLIGMLCRHINVIPVEVDVTNRGIVKTFAQRFLHWVLMGDVVNCGVVKTTGLLVTSTLRDFVDVAPARAN